MLSSLESSSPTPLRNEGSGLMSILLRAPPAGPGVAGVAGVIAADVAAAWEGLTRHDMLRGRIDWDRAAGFRCFRMTTTLDLSSSAERSRFPDKSCSSGLSSNGKKMFDDVQSLAGNKQFV